MEPYGARIAIAGSVATKQSALGYITHGTIPEGCIMRLYREAVRKAVRAMLRGQDAVRDVILRLLSCY